LPGSTKGGVTVANTGSRLDAAVNAASEPAEALVVTDSKLAAPCRNRDSDVGANDNVIITGSNVFTGQSTNGNVGAASRATKGAPTDSGAIRTCYVCGKSVLTKGNVPAPSGVLEQGILTSGNVPVSDRLERCCVTHGNVVYPCKVAPQGVGTDGNVSGTSGVGAGGRVTNDCILIARCVGCEGTVSCSRVSVSSGVGTHG
jgi:hypothetical protein